MKKSRYRPELRREHGSSKRVGAEHRLSELTHLHAGTYVEAQKLLSEVEQKTKVIERKIRNGELISKEEALGWLDLRKRLLENSINSWLIRDEMANLLPDATVRESAKNRVMQMLLKRRRLLQILENAERRINSESNVSQVLTDMQEEYNS